MSGKTKDELAAENAKLRGLVKELEEQLKARDAVARSSTEPGWLITTKNLRYSGVVLGVRIESGRGFLPKNRPGAERVLRQLVSDFGYTAREISAKDFEPGAGEPTEKTFLEKVSQ